MNVRRRRSDYRDDPSPRRMESRRRTPPRRPARQKRNAVTSVAMGFYKVLVVLPARIVAAYAGLSLMLNVPEEKQPP